MKIKIILILTLVTSFFMACNNQDWEYPDYPYTTVYFPIQYPARTLILGDYTQGDNSMDNEGRFEIGVTMAGVYENTKDRKVHFQVDPSLLNNVANVTALPSTHYTFQTTSPVTIPAGQTKGRITVQLTDAFFNDPDAVSDPGSTNYVIPLAITDFEGLDSLLTGKPSVSSPNRHVAGDWEAAPKDFTLYGIKFMNEFHGHYLRRGLDVMTDAGGAIVNSRYHAEFVERDEVIMVSTSGRRTVVLSNQVRRGGQDSPGQVNLVLNFSDGNNCSISSVAGDPYNATGTGKFVTDGDKWGGKPRDVIYLDYSYTDNANNETHAVKDTLVIRDRAAIFEQFAVELN